MSIKLGTSVRQIVTPIAGVVAKKQFDEVADCFQFLVENTDADGTVHSRWLNESEIEEVAAPAASDAPATTETAGETA